METNHNKKKNPYLNPYVAGFLLGLVLLLTFYMTGRGLGASGAVKSAVVTTVNTVSHEYATTSTYISQFISDDSHPMNNWLVFEVIGVLIGALISGILSGRLKFTIEHGPRITSKTRLIFAALGGLAFGFGSQLGRGCTSGAALSGMATISVAGFITMLAIFGSAYLFAWFFRKLWI